MRAILVDGAGVLCLCLLYIRKDHDLLEEKDLQLALFLAGIDGTGERALEQQIALSRDLAIKVLEATQHVHHVVDLLNDILHLIPCLHQSGHLVVQTRTFRFPQYLFDQQTVFGNALHRRYDQRAQLQAGGQLMNIYIRVYIYILYMGSVKRQILHKFSRKGFLQNSTSK